jgi:hypothetical protein
MRVFIEEERSTIIERTWAFTKGTRPFYWHGLVMVFIEWESSTIREGTCSFSKGTCWFYCQGIMMKLIEWETSTIREWTWACTKSSSQFYWQGVVREFIEEELFYDKRRNLTVYERLPVDFIGTESWWNLLNGSTTTIRERTCLFTKSSLSILFAQSHDGIYWMEAFPR